MRAYIFMLMCCCCCCCDVCSVYVVYADVVRHFQSWNRPRIFFCFLLCDDVLVGLNSSIVSSEKTKLFFIFSIFVFLLVHWMATSAIKSVTLFTSTKQVSVLLTVYSSKGSRHGRRKKRTSWQLCLPITHTHSSNKIYATMRLCWIALTATFKLGGSWQLLDFATIYIIQVYKIYALLINHLLLSCNNIQKTSILDSSKNPK